MGNRTGSVHNVVEASKERTGSRSGKGGNEQGRERVPEMFMALLRQAKAKNTVQNFRH
jgi:hypothetical protein